MTAAELDHRELVTLLATLGLMARLDGDASSEEVEFLDEIAADVGEERFSKAATEAAQFADAEAIVRNAGQVSRPEARELIFSLLYEMALAESIVAREAELLDKLASIWGLPQRAGA
jgi:hypothetical protein